MRFQTKFDSWLVLVLAVGAVITLGMPWMAPASPRILDFLAWPIWAFVLLATLPQYYEVRPDGLFIRQGIRKVLIAYDNLVEVAPQTDSRSAGVYSLDRVQVITRGQGEFVIAPRDQAHFFEELARQAPQLQRKGFGLGVTLG